MKYRLYCLDLIIDPKGNKMRISCCLIGEDSLLVQCGSHLLTRNHRIEVVVSPNKIIKDWAKKNNIACVSDIDDLLNLNINTVDYMFSIVNSYILSNEVLKLSNNGAINYHDSPLPKYAGLNSTVWAIINNEKTHGVTWHVVSNKIDEGGIVKQRIFPIEADDTAFTHNLRCYEEAIQSFSDMILDIEQGQLSCKKQNLKNRSYFCRTHVLPNQGFIDWKHSTADVIARTSRALTVGHYDNDVGSLKILLNSHYVIVSDIEISPIEYNLTGAGKILAIEKSALYVSTINQTIKINGFMSMTGKKLTINDMVKQYGLFVGYQFSELNERMIEENHHFYEQALKNETFWVNQLKDTVEHAIFSAQGIRKDNIFEELEPVIYFDNKNRNLDCVTKKNTILAAILIYLYRLNDYEKMSVFVVHEGSETMTDQCGNLFATLLPLVVSWHYDISLGGVVRYVDKRIKQIEQYNTYLTDISTRHPVLNDTVIDPRITINLTGKKFNTSCSDSMVLYFEYDPVDDKIHIYHRLNLAYKGGELQEVISNITHHVTNILDKLLNNPHVLANAFCFLAESERKKLLVDWGQGLIKPLPQQSIFGLFEKQVLEQPNSPAVVMGKKVVTYQQLWELSEKVASAIRGNHLPRQSLVGIYVNRSIEMLAIMLGILKADCVYVPLDTKYPILKIETIIYTADLSHVITSDEAIEKLTFHFAGKQTVKFHVIEKILLGEERVVSHDFMQLNQTFSDKLAYIMFTSGTTGAPKGVIVTQYNVINYCQWFCETTQFDASSIIDFSSSIAFDLSVPCTLAPLMVGGTIALCEDTEKTNPQRYLQHLIRNKVTHTELTPGYVEMLLNYPDLVRELVDLKVLLLGADVVLSGDVMKWLALCPNHRVVNEYGPTETTVSATSYFINKDVMVNEASVPIGRPAFNSSCYLLDKYGNLCPAGIKGELHIGGAQVTNGYLGKPALTKEKFIFSSFNNHQEIIYKTGDLACWLPDGNLQFFGRNDHQVKIQGYRIELAEIESVLLKMPIVHQAVVVVKQGHYKEKYLRVYLVVESVLPTISDIKLFLSSYLPSYMVPKEVCVTDAIPLKENEKIDFEALEKKACDFLTFEDDVGSELNEYEKISMRIWQHAFNDKAIGSHADFFEIGGDSLIALQIITELKKIYQIDIPLYYLFEYPTITLLAKKIESLVNKQVVFKSDHLPKSSKAIIKLATGSCSIPLFLVHPVGGSVFWYKQLAKCLNGQYTVYGIQDPNIDGCDIRFNSLEEMANYYINELKSVYEGDNYCLGGASFGATVAFEMAHQLRRANKKIEFLGLFDGWAEYPEDLMKENTSNLLSQREDAQLICSEQMDYLNNMEEYRKELLLRYKLSVLDADVVLFKAAELWPSFLKIDDCCNGWRPFIEGKITINKTQGNHETMFFDPNVFDLAKQLDDLKNIM